MDMAAAAAEIDAANAGEQVANTGTEQVQQTNTADPAQGQSPTIDPGEFKAFMEEMKQFRNQASSQLGQFGKRTSELDKFIAEQRAPKTQTPQSWATLDEAVKKSTREIVRQAWEAEFGDKVKNWDGVHESFQTQERNNRIMSIANTALGADFVKYDNALGGIYLQVKEAAKNGNEDAERFLKEIHETESGVYRLLQMAQAQVSQNLQAQSEKAKLEQEGKAKRAASGVGGGRVQSTSSGADGLPADKAERRKAIAAQIDAFNAQQ